VWFCGKEASNDTGVVSCVNTRNAVACTLVYVVCVINQAVHQT